MKPRGKIVTLAALMMIALLAVTITRAAAQEQFEVESVKLTIYRDGLIHVTQTLVVDELASEITLPLLSSSIENIIVLDENQTLVDYEVNGDEMTILTLGAKHISIEYDTLALTRKEAEVWTLVVDTPYNLTVFLPQNATLIYLSEMPSAIDISGTRIALSLHPSQWEISYVLPVLPEDENESRDASSTAIPIEYLIVAIIAVTAAVLSAVLIIIRRRGPNVEKILKANPQLKQEDKEVIEFLAEKGGKAFEAEIRERFPDMPRTSLWRLVRRLERLEIVEIKRIGLENQVELKK
ncbi:MAG: hypothetical protein NWF09_05225 [Candidatus Bathyarchaeota archaeon]|nr:hypothetical protein [Candidatus Bathyarchaeota archaeon]